MGGFMGTGDSANIRNNMALSCMDTWYAVTLVRNISSSRRSLLPTFLRFTQAVCPPAVIKRVARPQKQKQKHETNGIDVGGIKRHNSRTATS